MEYARSYYNPTIGSKETKNGSNIFLTDDDIQIAGTLLNWKTATAGVGKTDTNSVPNDSVCPTGWQLPVDDTNSKSYYNLIASIYSGTTGDGANSTNKNKQTGARIYASSQTLRQSPLSIPFSGIFNFASGAVNNVASAGYFWSSTSLSAPLARSLAFLSNLLNPQANNYKGHGFSVRCVAPKIFHHLGRRN